MYIAQINRWVKEGRVFTVGTAALAATDALGAAATADHVVTAPAIIAYVPESAEAITLLSLVLCNAGTVAGGRSEATCAYDIGTMYTSGGAAKTPVNKLAGGGGSPVLVYQSQSAAAILSPAATGARKYFGDIEFSQSVTAADAVPPLWYPTLVGGVVIQPGWCFMLYLRAATTGPTFKWILDYVAGA